MKKFYQIIAMTILALTVSACSSSSSSSSTGAGFIVSGSYNGTLNSTNSNNRSFSTKLSVNLNQAQDSSEADGNTLSNQITGTFAFAGGDRCWNGGTISGTINGSNINLTLTPSSTNSSAVILAGQQENNSFTSGTFSANNSDECGSVAGAFILERR